MRSSFTWIVVLILVVSAIGAKEFVAPKASLAKTYPAHDAHENERVSIAADPYDLPDKASIFTVHYAEENFLPVQLIITNDGDEPLSLANMKVQLVTVRKVKIAPATSEDLRRRFARQKRRGDEPPRNPLPVPLPRRKLPPTISKETEEEFQAAQFQAKAVEPHSTIGGFLFFDVEGIATPLAGARLYISGLRNGKGDELLYFEIPMEKYLSYRPGGK
jgi:hypothetical protein